MQNKTENGNIHCNTSVRADSVRLHLLDSIQLLCLYVSKKEISTITLDSRHWTPTVDQYQILLHFHQCLKPPRKVAIVKAFRTRLLIQTKNNWQPIYQLFHFTYIISDWLYAS